MIPLTWLKLSSDILHSKETEKDKNKDRVRQNISPKQMGGQGSPKHVGRAKGWAGFAKTCGQSKGVGRARQNMWTVQRGGQGSPKHVDRAKGWAGFAKRC